MVVVDLGDHYPHKSRAQWRDIMWKVSHSDNLLGADGYRQDPKCNASLLLETYLETIERQKEGFVLLFFNSALTFMPRLGRQSRS